MKLCILKFLDITDYSYRPQCLLSNLYLNLFQNLLSGCILEHCITLILLIISGLNYASPKKISWSPNPQYSVFRKQGLCRFNQTEVISVSPVWPVSLQQGDTGYRLRLAQREDDRKRHRKNTMGTQRIGVMHLQGKERQRMLENHWTLGRDKEGNLHVSEGEWRCQHLGFRLLASRTIKQHISAVLSYSILGTVFQQP